MSDPNELTIDIATEHDVPQILGFIRALAEYERLADSVVATEEGLRATLFGPRPYAECVIARFKGGPAGFALFFHNYSTFLGRPGVYLEDLFVKPDFRGKGVGRALLQYLAKVALDRNCGRLEWSVLDWNAPAIGFYKSLGAEPMEDWTIFRLKGEALARLAGAN
ncbi:MAG: GNAT family N-acetyltransferase [Vicinamibacteria bacterium]